MLGREAVTMLRAGSRRGRTQTVRCSGVWRAEPLEAGRNVRALPRLPFVPTEFGVERPALDAKRAPTRASVLQPRRTPPTPIAIEALVTRQAANAGLQVSAVSALRSAAASKRTIW